MTITKYYCIFPVPRKKKRTKIQVKKIVIKMKRHVIINLKFMLKLANSFDQVISDTDKHKHYLIFVRFQLLRTDLNY